MRDALISKVVKVYKRQYGGSSEELLLKKHTRTKCENAVAAMGLARDELIN